jgi:branched-chain amino acid transport system substrate-binding protein
MHRCVPLKIGALACLLILAVTPASAQIIVGVSTPMNSNFGKEIADGAQLAAEEVNERGGVLGKKIELRIVDDACNPAQAVHLAQKLIEADKAAVVIGYPCAGAALAARSVFTRNKTLMIALTSAPALTTNRDSQFVLRPIGRDDRLATAAVAYLKATFDGKKVGALLSEAPFGIGVSIRAATKVQFPLQLIETAKPDSGEPSWIKSVDALVVAGVAPQLVGRIARENAGVSLVMVTNVLSEQHYTLLAASKRAVAIANPNAKYFTGAKAAVESGRKRNLATDGYFIYAYAGIQIFANLANKVGSVSGDALAAFARKEPVPSLLGSLKFDDLGDPIGWRFAVFSDGPEGSVKPLDLSAVDLCKTDQCAQLDYCSKPCPNN